MAQLLADLGRQVVLSASGYGSRASEMASLAPSGGLDARRWGDEPAMLRELLPETPLIVGRDRVLAARICRREFPGSVLLLDDGFQHLPLRKHVSIVLDPSTPNHFCLPAGPYREPKSGASRASLVIPGEFLLDREFALNTPSGKPASRPQAAHVWTAIANGSRLADSLSEQGIHLLEKRYGPDHDPMLMSPPPPAGAPIIVTLKDWVKLRNREDVHSREILVANYSVRPEPLDRFRSWLENKLNEVETAS